MRLLFVAYIPLDYNSFTRKYFTYCLTMEHHSVSVSHLVRRSSRGLILDRLAESGKVDYLSPFKIAQAMGSRKYDGILVFNQKGLFFSQSNGNGTGWSTPHFLLHSPDLSLYRFNQDLSDLYRCALSLESTLVVGQVGEFIKKNNQNFTLSVFRNLQKSNAKSRLLLVGDGPLRMMLTAQIDYEYLPVLMPGDTLSLHTMLAAMDVLLFPTDKIDPYLMEEARSAGLPCIVSSQANGIKQTEDIIKLDLDELLWAETIGTLQIDNPSRSKRSHDFLDSRIKAQTAQSEIIPTILKTTYSQV